MPSFFFRELQLIAVLLLICDSYMSCSTRLVSLKLCVGLSVFNSVSFLLKFIFLFNKMHRFFDSKTSQFLSKLKSYKKHTEFCSQTPDFFKLQQNVLKLNDVYVSWSSPKADVVTNFLK